MLSTIVLFLVSCLQLPLELGVLDVSAVSVMTGLLSVLAVLPAGVIISSLFRLREVRLKGSGVQHAKGAKTDKDFLGGENLSMR